MKHLGRWWQALALAALMGLGSGCGHAPPDTNAATVQAAQDLRHYAASRCLARAATSDADRADAQATAAAYLERGDAPLAVYEALDRQAAQALATPYAGRQPVAFNTMKCLDLAHSAGVSAVIDQALAGAADTAAPR